MDNTGFRFIQATPRRRPVDFAITARITQSPIALLIPGVLLLLAFIPQHIMLWDKFPLWYHLTFLLSLVPLTYAGARIAEWGRGSSAIRA